MDLANAVIYFFENIFCFPKLAGMLVVWICQCFFVKMGVNSYPFKELIVNLAS